jgi:acyl-CoA thioesterase I
LSARIVSAIPAVLSRSIPFGYGATRLARNAAVVLLLAATPAAAETVTVAALGDSLTMGYGLPPDDGFVPQLQAWLDERGVDAEVLNAGVSGDTTAGGLSRVGWTLSPEVDAMIVELGGNDMLRGLDPAETRRNLDGILAAARDADVEVLLVGFTAPSNYGPEFKSAFDAIYPDLARKYGAALYPSYFAPLEALQDRNAAMRDYVQPDGLHPNARGIDLIVDAIGPAVADLVARVAD